MNRNRKLYNRIQVISAFGMIIALLWLTVSMPFVNASQKEWAKANNVKPFSPLGNTEEESTCPIGNTSEEKAPGQAGGNLSEEFLHDHYSTHHFFSELLTFHKNEDDGTYIAFHGELLVPPPNIA